jgi:Leucine-rich repeat (LRR) protein
MRTYPHKNTPFWDGYDLQLSHPTFLSSLTQLTCINLCKNQIQTLEWCAPLIHLKELYLRNNQLKRMHQLIPLKNLKHLSLLDLRGNVVVEKKGYRHNGSC